MILPKEIWKDIPGYPDYQVSQAGHVRSLNYNHTGKKRRLKLQKDRNGYLLVKFYKNGEQKNFLVHRIVTTAFIPNPNNYPCINHKDENPSNNCIDNLEWCDVKYNNNYGNHNKKISQALVGEKNPMAKQVICITTGEVFSCTMDAERITGIANSSISANCNGKRKSAGKINGEPRKWIYVSDFLNLAELTEL